MRYHNILQIITKRIPASSFIFDHSVFCTESSEKKIIIKGNQIFYLKYVVKNFKNINICSFRAMALLACCKEQDIGDKGKNLSILEFRRIMIPACFRNMHKIVSRTQW